MVQTYSTQKAIHPGEVLAEEFLAPMGITQYRLAKEIGVPARRINEIVLGTRAITADTALRLATALGTSAQFWMNLQTKFDLVTYGSSAAIQKQLAAIEPLHA